MRIQLPEGVSRGDAQLAFRERHLGFACEPEVETLAPETALKVGADGRHGIGRQRVIEARDGGFRKVRVIKRGFWRQNIHYDARDAGHGRLLELKGS